MTARRRLALSVLVAAGLTAPGCGTSPVPDRGPAERGPPRAAPPPRAATAPARTSALHFVDVTEASGLGSFRQRTGAPDKPELLDAIGGGVAFLDHDGDGVLDIYLTNASALEDFPPGEEPRDALFRGLGDGTFEDVTEGAGLGDELWTCGVTVADHDGDGDPDIFLTNHGPNRLYSNAGDGTFTDVTEAAGLGDPGWGTGAAFFDLEGDGDLDLYVANYIDFAPGDEFARQTYRGIDVAPGPSGLPRPSDRLYRNEGDGTFTDITEESGVGAHRSYGFQVVAFDVEDDGDVDLLVANDSMANFLWLNDGAGGLSEVALPSMIAFSEVGKAQAGMGIAVGDHDGDGRADVYMTHFSEDYNTLYRNDGGGLFTDVTPAVGLAHPTYMFLAWGCGFFDADNDGDQDIHVANGHIYPQVDEFNFGFSYLQANQLFENVGDGRYRDRTTSAGPGFELVEATRGAAHGDFDGDGDLDLLFGNIDGKPRLLRNDTADIGHWLRVHLVGTSGHPDAVGAAVVLMAGGRRQRQVVVSGGSFLSSHAPGLHFGLGSSESVESLEVTWPGGRTEVFTEVPVDAVVTVTEGAGLRE